MLSLGSEQKQYFKGPLDFDQYLELPFEVIYHGQYEIEDKENLTKTFLENKGEIVRCYSKPNFEIDEEVILIGYKEFDPYFGTSQYNYDGKEICHKIELH